MHNPTWPAGTTETLLQSDAVRKPTKAVLQERLGHPSRPPQSLFDAESFALLQTVCDRMFPQERNPKIQLPEMLEEVLVTGPGEGWRYDALPPINKAIVDGLKGIDAEANTRFQQSFAELSFTQQDAVLRAVQDGKTTASAWGQLRPNLFFTELLVRLAELYYSHPLAKDEIGDVSFVDAQGWQKLGLNILDVNEPQPIIA